jgi:hypothetical protein
LVLLFKQHKKMKKLFLIICCLGIFFSIHAQDPKPKEVYTEMAAPKPLGTMVTAMGIEPPKFSDCKCSGYKVTAGVAGKPYTAMANNSNPIILQQGEDLGLTAELICKSDNPETPCCSSKAWELVDLTDGGATVITKWSYNNFPSQIQTKGLKCDRTYAVVLQGRCGCTVCDPFLVKFTYKCKDCCNDLKAPIITSSSPRSICLTDTCSQTFSYKIQDYPTDCPVRIQWFVTSESGTQISVASDKQAISFSCKNLKPGTYTISVTVYCKDKKLTSTRTLTVCQTPNAKFKSDDDVSNYTATTTTPAQQDYWIMADDLDGDCKLSLGDVAHSINGTPMDWTSGTSISFTNLAPEKSYLILHISINQCGSTYCIDGFLKCYKYAPLFKMMKPEVTPFNIMSLPAQLRKGLPKKAFEVSKSTDSIKD